MGRPINRTQSKLYDIGIDFVIKERWKTELWEI